LLLVVNQVANLVFELILSLGLLSPDFKLTLHLHLSLVVLARGPKRLFLLIGRSVRLIILQETPCNFLC
jgi:hypothetical protein